MNAVSGWCPAAAPPPRRRSPGCSRCSSARWPTSMIDEMRPFTRRAVAVLVCQIGTITPSTSAVVISVTGLRPSLGNTYGFKDDRQPSPMSRGHRRNVGS